jgi:hypothetical protein
VKLPFVGMDEYDRHARLKPALVAFLPVTLTMLALAPEAITSWSGALAIVIQAGGSYLLAQIIGDIGKKKEPELFKKFGGRPTDRLLSHKTAPNKTTLVMRHAKLGTLMDKVKIPTAKAEEKDPAGAADVYAACVDFLRGKFRQNPAVFRENKSYGFRRNLWAIKNGGVIASTIGVVVVAAELYGLASVHQPINEALWFIGGLNLLMLVLWILFITPSWVMRAAQLYADRLLEALDAL